jgi:hypothetical protein
MNKSSVHNLDNLTKLIGRDGMREVRTSVVQKMLRNSVTDGEFNPNLLIKNFRKLTPEVKQSLFGPGDEFLEEMERLTKQTRRLNVAKGVGTVVGLGAFGGLMTRGDYKTAAVDLLATLGLGGSAFVPKVAGVVDPLIEKGLRTAGKPAAKAIGSVIQKGVPAAIPATELSN